MMVNFNIKEPKNRTEWRKIMSYDREIRTDIDWESLTFSYMPTRSNIRYKYANGAWDNGTLTSDFNISMSIAATCLHYGQNAFEGIKAFRCKDGKVRIFRPWQNHQRMNRTAHQLLGPELPEELFIEALTRVVRDNIDYVPPYGSGGSLYIRPLFIGTGAQIGVAPASEYEFIVMVMPVGKYYKEGLKGVPALVIEDFDRAAPKGMGSYKVAGNYGASLMPAKLAKNAGYPIPLFLDPKEHKYIDEFGTSNFLAITKDGKYVTSDSPSILPSVTNMSLMQVAEDLGLTVEKRPIIAEEELPEFAEVDACGTAVVITPISSVTIHGKTIEYGQECGPVSKKLYDRLTGIQYGEIEDTHGWLLEV